jgi:hypothetical protein
MIILVLTFALIYFCLSYTYQIFKGQTGPQVHAENKKLREEIERLRNK